MLFPLLFARLTFYHPSVYQWVFMFYTRFNFGYFLRRFYMPMYHGSFRSTLLLCTALVAFNLIQLIRLLRFNSISFNLIRYDSIASFDCCIFDILHAILCFSMLFNAFQCNSMQFHAMPFHCFCLSAFNSAFRLWDLCSPPQGLPGIFPWGSLWGFGLF